MSAFLVSELTMHRAVKAMDGDRNSDCDTLDFLGRQLFTLNALAMHERYGDDTVITEMTEYKYSPVFPSQIPLFKSLSCLIYQCSEGKVPENHLYVAITAKADYLARFIVQQLPEFDEADWD